MSGDIMTMKFGFLIATLLSAITFSARAHHSVAAGYDTSKPITIKGEVVKVAVRNPHSIIHIMVKSEGGKTDRWTAEWDGVAALENQGVFLKPKDQVEVTGLPGRNPEDHRIRVTTIKREKDGKQWGGSLK
jgi:hypothetical protein